MDVRTSWLFGHHGYLDIMDIQRSWIFFHHLYLDIDIIDILGEHKYPGKLDVPENDTFEAFQMQTHIA